MVHTFSGYNGAVCGLDFSPDGSLLAAVGPMAEVKLWDVAGGQVTQDLQGHRGNWSVSLAFVPEGSVVATATDGDGNSSEFSEPVQIVEPGYYIFLPLVLRNY